MKPLKTVIALADILYRNLDEVDPGQSIWAPYFWEEGKFRGENNLFILSKEHLEMLFHRKFPVDKPYWVTGLWNMLKHSSSYEILPVHFGAHNTWENFDFMTYVEAHRDDRKYIVPVVACDPGRFSDWYRSNAELPEEVLEDIKSGKAILVIECPWEGNHTRSEDIDNFDRWIEREGLGDCKDRIWYLTNVLGGKMCDYLKAPERKFRYRGTPFFEELPWGDISGVWGRTYKGDGKDGLLEGADILEKYIDSKAYSFDKKFLALFGSIREHRLFLYGFINVYPNLKETSIVSLRNNYNCWDLLSNPNSYERDFIRGIDESVDRFIGELGSTEEQYDHRILVEEDTGNLYSVYQQPIRDRCCIELITETGYGFNDCITFTEKTFKGILSKKPFILIGGSYGVLKTLRSLGYETFGDFWDESYDLIEDPKERLKAVGKLLLDIDKHYSLEDLKDLKKQMKPILDYNFNLMVNSQRFRDTIRWYSTLCVEKKWTKFV